MSDAVNPDHYKRLPAEAIEIIESAIDNAPSNQDAYLHGQVLKYILRCWNKNGIEDLKKAKWYLDRLIEHCDLRESLLDISNGLVKAWACENGKAKQVYPEQLQPPDGWRFLDIGEVIRNGDRCFTKHSGSIDCLNTIGEKYETEKHYPTIRRNRFEVGEKVVRVSGECVYKITAILDGGYYEMQTPSGYKVCLYAIDLAPYIEETK